MILSGNCKKQFAQFGEQFNNLHFTNHEPLVGTLQYVANPLVLFCFKEEDLCYPECNIY